MSGFNFGSLLIDSALAGFGRLGEAVGQFGELRLGRRFAGLEAGIRSAGDINRYYQPSLNFAESILRNPSDWSAVSLTPRRYSYGNDYYPNFYDGYRYNNNRYSYNLGSNRGFFNRNSSYGFHNNFSNQFLGSLNQTLANIVGFA